MTNVEQTEQDYAVVKGLTETELTDLKRCEKIIAAGINTFVEVGNALMKIRDQRLYREQYPTFEEYLSNAWGISRARGYQLIEAATVTSSLSTMVDKPQNERQVRVLAKVPAEHRDRVWEQATKDAAAEGRPVTTKDVVDNAGGWRGNQYTENGMGRLKQEAKRLATGKGVAAATSATEAAYKPNFAFDDSLSSAGKKRMRVIRSDGIKGLVQAVERGVIAVAVGERIAKNAPDVQQELLRKELFEGRRGPKALAKIINQGKYNGGAHGYVEAAKHQLNRIDPRDATATDALCGFFDWAAVYFSEQFQTWTQRGVADEHK